MKELVLPQIMQSKGSENLYNLDLCYIEDEQNIPPKITFVISENEVVKSLDSLEISGSELVKHSFKNLSKIEINYKDATICEKGLLYFDQKYASEKILDKTFSENIAKELGANKLLVSLPARDSLLICAADNSKASESLILKSQKIYNDFSKEPISLLVFTIEQGSIKSAYSPALSSDTILNETISFGSYTEDISKVKLFEDLYNYRIVVSADKIEDLQNGLFHTVLKLIKENRYKANFEKGIEIISSGDLIKKNRINTNNIRLLLDKIEQNHNTDSNQSTEKPIKLSFQFHKDFQNGNSHYKIIKHLK